MEQLSSPQQKRVKTQTLVTRGQKDRREVKKKTCESVLYTGNIIIQTVSNRPTSTFGASHIMLLYQRLHRKLGHIGNSSTEIYIAPLGKVWLLLVVHNSDELSKTPTQDD